MSPLHNSGPCDYVNNYSPFYLFCPKFFKKKKKKKTRKKTKNFHFSSKNILNEYNLILSLSGFMSAHSCEMALVNKTDRWLNSLDKKTKVMLITASQNEVN